MSWSDSVLAAALHARTSPIESARFGFSVARIVSPMGDEASSSADVTREVGRLHADVHVIRYPAARTQWFAELAGRHERIVHADTLLYWSLELDPAVHGQSHGLVLVRPDEAESFVASTFADYPTHYSANPLFSPEKRLAGYQDWSRRAAERADAFGLLDGGNLVALATFAVQVDVLEVELAGVLPGHQRRGWYPQLIAGVAGVAMRRSCSRVVISTQASQAHVQRVWARAGFLPVAALHTVHVMGGRRDGDLE